MRTAKLKSIFTTILAIAVFVTMCAPSFMLISAKKADAKTTKSINIGTDNIPQKSGKWTFDDSYLYYGSYGGYAIRYRILSNDGQKMLMDSDMVLYMTVFDKNNGIDYSKSTVRDEIKDGTKFFSTNELKNIASTTLAANSKYTVAKDRTMNFVGGDDTDYFIDYYSTDNKSFLLSAKEVENYYTNETAEREVGYNFYFNSGPLMLRSQVHYYSAGKVYDDAIADLWKEGGIGRISNHLCATSNASLCPASYLNLGSNILFSSVYNQSKGTTAGTLEQISASSDKTWKLTLKDTSKGVSAKKGSIDANKKVTIPVTITKGSDISQVSVVITNGDISSSNTEILYYGKMDGIDTTSRSEQKGTFTLPDNLPSTYKAYAIAEDVNADTTAGSITDYASDPVAINFGYLVDFETNGATSGTASSQVVDPNGTVQEPTGILKTGYILKGWFDNSSFSGNAFNFATAITKSMTLYAKWEAENYNITYNLNGGSEPSPANPTSYTIASDAITLKAPSKANLSFAGWTGSNGTSPQTSVTIPKGSTGTKSYTANWNATITFDTKGGSSVANKVVAENTVVKESDVATPIKNNLHFAGWYDDENYNTKHDFTKPVTKNTKLYAKWTADVTFNAKGGTPTPNKQTVKEGDKAISPGTITRAGYTFKSWYNNASYTGDPYNFATAVMGDLVLYAKWETVDYTITYNLNGGSEPSPANPTNYTVESNAITLKAPSKANLSFAGWTGSNGTSPQTSVTIPKGSTGTKSYTANWNATITFDTKGGSSVANKVVAENTVVKESDVATPIKNNLHFAGWYDDENYNTKHDFTKPVTKNTKLYAKWTADVTFNSKGGTPTPSKQTVKEGDQAAIPTDVITRVGYTFKGWYDNASYTGDPYNFATAVMGDLILYAKWTTIEYALKIDLNGGSEPNPPNPTGYNIEETVTLREPTKEDLSFAGWTSESEGITTPQKEVTIQAGNTGEKDFKANWNATMSFNTNGGSKIADKVVAENTVVKESDIAPPTKDNLHFAGWYDDENYNTKHDFTKPVTKNTKLYAKWTADVTFNSNGGSAIDTKTVTEGETVEIPSPDPEKANLHFAGWYKDKDCTDGQEFDFKTDTITGDKTLYAKWEAKITLDTKGGSKVDEKVVAEGTVLNESDITAPEKDNLHFAGWYDDEDYATKHDFTKPFTQDMKLYAKWEATITFDTKGGSAIADKVVAENTIINENDLVTTKENLDFAGWYDDEEYATKHDFTKPVTKDTKLYAKWEAKVTFDSNGGSLVPVQAVKEGDKAIKPLDPTKRGYTFNAWYLKKVTQEEKTTNQEQQETTPLLYAINPVMLLFADANSLIGTPVDALGDTDKEQNLDPEVDGDTDKDDNIDEEEVEVPYDFDTIVTGSFALIAHWDIVNYDIAYKGLTNAKVAENPVTYNVESDEITLNNPTKDGYTFTGWTGDGVTKPTKNMTIAKGSVGNKTFTANWEKKDTGNNTKTSDETNVGLLAGLALSSLVIGVGVETATRRKK